MGSTWNSGPDKGRREDSTHYVANVPWLTYLNKVDLPPADAGAVEHPRVRWGRGPAYCARVEGPNVRRQVLKGRGAEAGFEHCAELAAAATQRRHGANFTDTAKVTRMPVPVGMSAHKLHLCP